MKFVDKVRIGGTETDIGMDCKVTSHDLQNGIIGTEVKGILYSTLGEKNFKLDILCQVCSGSEDSKELEKNTAIIWSDCENNYEDSDDCEGVIEDICTLAEKKSITIACSIIKEYRRNKRIHNLK